jgi:hypothetical protein
MHCFLLWHAHNDYMTHLNLRSSGVLIATFLAHPTLLNLETPFDRLHTTTYKAGRLKKPAKETCISESETRTYSFCTFVAFSPGFAQIVVISSNHNSAGFICRSLFTIEYAIQ